VPTGRSLNDTGGGSGGSRVQRALGWLRERSDSAVGRLALLWFRSYMAASRNSGCAIGMYSSLSLVPAALAFVAAVHGGGVSNAFTQHLIHHLHLTGRTATLLEDGFGAASSHAFRLSMVVTFLFWGIGIGQLYKDVYARAWGISARSPSDQALYAIFFFVFAGALALSMIVEAELGATGRWAVLVPAWILGSLVFWLATPFFLLHGKVSLRKLLPGALLAELVLGGTIVFSPLFVPSSLNKAGANWGYYGVVLTVVAYTFILATLSLVCAVFSPVWFAWRAAEKSRGDGTPEGESRPAPGQ